jgi:O-antigen/teichoic acid export membrane protein
MEEIISRSIERIYRRFFGEELTEPVNIFFKNLIYMILGYGVAAIFIFIFQILVGRALGPQEYGKYALIDSMGAFLSIFMTLGISTAAIKYNAQKDDYLRQREIISISYFTTIFISLIFAGIFLILSEFVSKFFSISPLVFFTSVVFSVFYSLYLLAMDSLSGLHQMKKIAFFRAIYGLLVLVLTSAFLIKGNISFVVISLIISLAYLIIFLSVTYNIKNYISLKIDKTWLKILLEFGIYAVSGSFLLVFLPSLSKIMVYRFMTIFDVGVYNAYYFSSLSVVILFNTIFITVFFPTVSRYSRKSSIIEKINKITPIFFLLGIPFLFLIQLVVLSFFGKQYPTDYWLMLLFAISGVMFFLYSIYTCFFYSQGITQTRQIVILTIVIFIINILLSAYLIPLLLLKGAVLSLILTYLFGWIYLILNQKNLTN